MAILHSDDFETGDFTNWTGIFNTPTVEGTHVHGGSYAMKVDTNHEYAFQTGLNNATVYCRLWIYVPAIPSGTDKINIIYLKTADNSVVAQVRIMTDRWRVYDVLGAFWDYVATPQANTWYEVILAIFVDAAAGWIDLYINGTRQINSTGLNTDNGHGNITYYYVGSMAGAGTDYEAWIDDEVTASTLAEALTPAGGLATSTIPMMGVG